MIHDPAVLILDEPTSGLDPNQLAEIRKLIREVSANKTVIFSTHIMQEVQAICERVVVINRGTIVANDKLETLLARHGAGDRVVVEFEAPIDVADMSQIPGISRIEDLGGNRYRITRTGDIRAEIFRYAAERNLALVGLKQEESSLENIFRELTKLPEVPYE